MIIHFSNLHQICNCKEIKMQIIIKGYKNNRTTLHFHHGSWQNGNSINKYFSGLARQSHFKVQFKKEMKCWIVASRNTMIVREDMHTHYTRVSFKDEFQNTVVHSKNANWNKIHKETLNAFTPTRVLLFYSFLWVYSLWQGYTKRQRRGWRESWGDSGQKMDKSRGKKWLAAVTVTHLKNGWANGIVKEDRLKSVSNIVASFCCWSFHIPPVVISKVISSFPRTKFVMQVFMFFFFWEIRICKCSTARRCISFNFHTGINRQNRYGKLNTRYIEYKWNRRHINWGRDGLSIDQHITYSNYNHPPSRLPIGRISIQQQVWACK